MTLFDLIAVLVLGVSALVGLVNGAVREVVGLFAFGLAASAAILLLPVVGPIARHTFHPAWTGNAAAIAVVFVATYIAVRLSGRWLTQRLRDTGGLGTLDRIVGGAIGVARGLALLGVFYLLFNALTPSELRQDKGQWIEGAVLYPLARASGETLRALTPEGMARAGRVGPLLKDAVTRGATDDGVELGTDRTTRNGLTVESGPPEARPESEPASRGARRAGYGPGERSGLDGLVERSR